MKKLFLLLLVSVLFIAPTATRADTLLDNNDFGNPGTGAGTGSQTCDPNSTTNTCQTGYSCQIDGKCVQNVCNPACTGGLICNALHVCVTSTSAAPGGSASSTGSIGSTDLGFVSLTKIPGFDVVGNSGSLVQFLNNIYKYCIGLAAVLAVLQLIRAGIMYMLEGGFVEKKEAKHLIQQTIVGLLLVLSPVIVFGIINPKILSLNIDTSNLQTPFASTSSSTSLGGYNPPTGDGSCNFDCVVGKVCQKGTCVDASTATGASCDAYDIDGYSHLEQGQTCASVYESVDQAIDIKCCDSSATPESGYTCCARKK